MDVRISAKNQDFSNFSSDKLTDSLIFNILKKLELKQSMQEKYERTRTPQLKQISQYFGRHLHSAYSIGYLGTAISALLYLRFRNKKSIKISSTFPHIVIAISINQYFRYRNIMKVDTELYNQYTQHKNNTKLLIEQKKNRISIVDQIVKSNYITYPKLLKMIQYKPLY